MKGRGSQIMLCKVTNEKGKMVKNKQLKEGAEFAIEKCPVGAEFGSQNINFSMEVFCAIILRSPTHSP